MRVLPLLLLLIALGCQSNSQDEINQLKNELEACKIENEKLLETPEHALNEATRSRLSGNDLSAESKLHDLIDRYPTSEEAKTAQMMLDSIVLEKEENQKLKNEKLVEGFKDLKEKSTVKVEGVTLAYSNIKIENRWVFDRYDDRYFYHDAERGEKHITASLKISSETKDPKLPPTYVFKLENGILNKIGQLKYRFYRWKDYGSYLGNYGDYGNDFAHSETIRFSPGAAFKENDLTDFPIFIMVEKFNCMSRHEDRFANPCVSYVGSSYGNKTMDAQKAKKEFELVKVINKEKL